MKETPLHIAIKEGHIDVIRTLLEKGVSVDVTDVKGNSVYHLAAATDESIIQVLCCWAASSLYELDNNLKEEVFSCWYIVITVLWKCLNPITYVFTTLSCHIIQVTFDNKLYF